MPFRTLNVLKPGGTLISILGLSDVAAQKAKDKMVNASAWLVQSSGADMNALAQLLITGTIKSHVSRTFPFEKMIDAHKEMETGGKGKIVIQL